MMKQTSCLKNEGKRNACLLIGYYHIIALFCFILLSCHQQNDVNSNRRYENMVNSNMQNQIQFILTQVSSDITKGMSEEEIFETIWIFREIILPIRLRGSINAERLVESIRKDIAGLDLKERKKYVLVNKYRYLIEPLDDRAFELAQQAYLSPDSRPELQNEALKLKTKLLDIAKEIKNSNPQLYNIFSNSISESLLDYKYVLTGNTVVSLRMGVFMTHK